MSAEMQEAVQSENKNIEDLQPEMRFAYFGRLEKLNINKKGAEYVQHVHNGVTCVGYQIANNGNSMLLGVSFCSPEDTFSKKKAHTIIKGRIATGKSHQLNDPNAEGSFAGLTYENLVDLIKKTLTKNIAVDAEGKVIDDAKFAGVGVPYWFAGV